VDDHHNQPLGHERVHAKHPSLHGAVCRVHSAHTYMLTRQLFYTAITRAKKGVVLVGNRKGLAAATSAKTPPKRNTTLIQRMRALVLEDVGGALSDVAVENDGTASPALTAAAITGEDDLSW
jgi:hypothetical protein